MLNPIPAQPAARQPRGIVKLNGAPVAGWISWEVTSNTYYEADTFRVSFAVSTLPKDHDVTWFFTQQEVYVEIFAGFPNNPADPNAAELVSQIYGRADEIEFDPVSTLITLHGRDLTALYIDNKVTDTYTEKTSSEIAVILALAEFLTPVVTPTKTKAATYYKREQVTIHANRSRWDLLAYLAREEGFVCYVTGNELHFEPDTLATADPYVIHWEKPTPTTSTPTANVQELSFSRALTVARGVNVTVRSASLTKKVPVVESYPGHAKAIQAGKAGLYGSVQQYDFKVKAGTTPMRAQQIAQSRYHEIVSHEMKLRARLPGDNLLTTKNVIRVEGTGTPVDQIYFPMAITRMMSMDEGYTMTVDAKNLNPNTVAINS